MPRAGYENVVLKEGPPSGSEPIYHLSRALYRRLAPVVVEDRPRLSSNRQRVLDACEFTMRRLVEEPNFARPSRFLFDEIRFCFAMSEQLWLRRIIDVHIDFATPLVEELRAGTRRSCAAYSRRGSPCQREAVAGRDYCPSHGHLEPVAGTV
jgi:hypothetical protein